MERKSNRRKQLKVHTRLDKQGTHIQYKLTK